MSGVNADGTRLAMLDLRAEIERLYEFEAKFRTGGRKPLENPSPKTLAQRKWRAKKKEKG